MPIKAHLFQFWVPVTQFSILLFLIPVQNPWFRTVLDHNLQLSWYLDFCLCFRCMIDGLNYCFFCYSLLVLNQLICHACVWKAGPWPTGLISWSRSSAVVILSFHLSYCCSRFRGCQMTDLFSFDLMIWSPGGGVFSPNRYLAPRL